MANPKVYLAGPIAGLTFDGAQEWRHVAQNELARSGIDGYSPLRNKEYLRSEGVINNAGYQHPLSSDRGIMTRDYWDCKTSDLIFAYLLGAKDVSQGTDMEMAWAYAYRKPLVVVMEDKGNPHDHPMVRAAIDYRVTTLAEGIAIAKAILLPHIYANHNTLPGMD